MIFPSIADRNAIFIMELNSYSMSFDENEDDDDNDGTTTTTPTDDDDEYCF